MTDFGKMTVETADISAVMDELWGLRVLCALEAQRVSEDLEFKTYPKRRRALAEAHRDALRAAARGSEREVTGRIANHDERQAAMDAAGADIHLNWGTWTKKRPKD